MKCIKVLEKVAWKNKEAFIQSHGKDWAKDTKREQRCLSFYSLCKRGQAADPQQQGERATSAGLEAESLTAGRENGKPGNEERRETSKELKLQFLQRKL